VSPRVADLTLVPLTEEARETFVEEELANYADEQIRDAGWPAADARDRARAEFLPELERELAEAAVAGERLWSAVRADGVMVGWLWVRPRDGGAFLYQITVAEAFRRQGYGRAMLAALEATLAGEGTNELHLTVNVANEPAQRLYEAAGYEQVGADERVFRLRKRLRSGRE
jgi:ribosomal protein S18 acetylase RimI-like enzyme